MKQLGYVTGSVQLVEALADSNNDTQTSYWLAEMSIQHLTEALFKYYGILNRDKAGILACKL